MKKRLLPIALGFLLLSQGAFAQSRPVRGQVLDDKGEPVVGAGVQIKGTNQGTVTDADGKFSLEVPDDDNTLIIRSVGFATQEVQAGDGLQPLVVHFSHSSTTLNETIILGYTAVKRKDLTGSVSTVGAETIKDIPNVTIEKAMEGRMPGVHVVQNSGTPGAGIDVRVRGTTSIMGETQPLYVIDGVPVTTGSPSQLDLGGQNMNALAQIDPNDIASIEVLKDAATAAMYGAQAANGVVLITTKSGSYGQKGHATVHANVSFGTQSAWKKLKTLNNQQYFDLIGDEIRNYTGDQTITNEDALGMLGMSMNKDYTNYLDYIFQPGQLQNHSVDVSGGGEKTSYYASVGYFKNDGILRSSSLDRYSTRLNIKTMATDRITLSTNLGFTRTNEQRVRNDNNIFGYMLPSLLTPPDYTLYNEDGTYTPNPFGWANVASIANSYYNHVGTNRFIGNVSAEVKIVEGLSLVSKIGADMMSMAENEYDPANTAAGAGTNGSGIAGTNATSKWINEDYLSFNRTYGNSNIIAAAGLSFQEWKQDLTAAQATDFSSIYLHTLDNASTPVTSSSSSSIDGMRSYYANVHYSYADRYLISGSFRYDASSRFPESHKWAAFPGVSAAWRISNEDFFKNIKKTVSDLKLRVGYGVTGNLPSQLYPIALYSSRPLANTIGTYYSNLDNPDLVWEKNQEFDLGLDIGFLNNRIYLTADYYHRITPNLILSRPYGGQTGFDGRVENIGEMKNQGIELNITSQNIQTKDFTWTTTLNLSHNKNTVVKLYDGKDIQYGFSGSTILREGEEVGAFYGYKVAGIFQNQDEIDNSPTQDGAEPGDFKFVDANGDGVINDDDRVILGSPNPKIFGGLGNTLTYKGLSLDIFCQFSAGNKIFNANKSYINGMNSVFNQTDEVLDRWTPDNPSNTMPRAVYNDPNNNWRNSSAMVENGSYFRIKNVTLAYNFNAKTLNFTNGIIKGLRIYATANNLVTFTEYSGFDPEVNMFDGSAAVLGTDFGTYPQARSFVFGANFTF